MLGEASSQDKTVNDFTETWAWDSKLFESLSHTFCASQDFMEAWCVTLIADDLKGNRNFLRGYACMLSNRLRSVRYCPGQSV